MEPSILSEIKGAIGYITLNRPNVFNSFNRPMALALQEALQAFGENTAVRTIVLTGSGKAFCAGQDLAEAMDPQGPGIRNIVVEHYNPIILAIRNLDKPVIAAVNGVAAGAGANIALACDIVVARKSASFMQAFSALGLIPDSGGTYTLPRLIGWQKASALMMLAEKVVAEEAERMGMIYKWFEDEVFQTETDALAARVAAMPTRGLALTKELLNASSHNDLEQQLAAEAEWQVMAAGTADYREGVSAFLEKRKPVFKGI